MDYSGTGFAKLKYIDTLTPTNSEGSIHIDSHTDLISTWLHLKIFHHWIRNSISLTPKYSELLVSHHGDFKSEGYLYLYPSQAVLDSKVLCSWLCSAMMYSYISSACHTSISTPFGYEDNQCIWHTTTYTWYRYHPSNSVSFDRELI